jgi:hypothetical protein
MRFMMIVKSKEEAIDQHREVGKQLEQNKSK